MPTVLILKAGLFVKDSLEIDRSSVEIIIGEAASEVTLASAIILDSLLSPQSDETTRVTSSKSGLEERHDSLLTAIGLSSSLGSGLAFLIVKK